MRLLRETCGEDGVLGPGVLIGRKIIARWLASRSAENADRGSWLCVMLQPGPHGKAAK